MSLETYIPAVREVAAGGKVVAVSPLRVRQIPAFAKAVLPVAPLLADNDFAAAVALHGDALATAVAVATGENEAFVGELQADEFIDLVAAVMEVNVDFFTLRVLPKIEAIKARTSGATSFPSSSVTATD